MQCSSTGTQEPSAAMGNGFETLSDASDDEEDMLDKAWGLEAESRLSCQVEISEFDLEIELPKYTINMVSENH